LGGQLLLRGGAAAFAGQSVPLVGLGLLISVTFIFCFALSSWSLVAMARKSAKAKAAPKGKARKTEQEGQEGPSSSQLPFDVYDATDVAERECEAQQKRRRLDRRDSEEQAKRIIDDKLVPKFGEAIAGRVGRSGVNVWSFIVGEWRRLKAEKKYWTARQMSKLYVEFELTEQMNELLEDHQGDLNDVGPKMKLALRYLNAKNPKERSPDEFEFFLAGAGELEKVDLFGLLCACVESDLISKSTSSRCFTAIGAYFARLLHPEPENTSEINVKYIARKIRTGSEGEQSTSNGVLRSNVRNPETTFLPSQTDLQSIPYLWPHSDRLLVDDNSKYYSACATFTFSPTKLCLIGFLLLSL
jgi:hypothetical protein